MGKLLLIRYKSKYEPFSTFNDRNKIRYFCR
jgi:hypothetical protein